MRRGYFRGFTAAENCDWQRGIAGSDWIESLIDCERVAPAAFIARRRPGGVDALGAVGSVDAHRSHEHWKVAARNRPLTFVP